MTPEEFRAALKDLGMRQVRFAEATGMAPTTVSRWAKGIQPVPKWAEFLVAVLKNNRASLKLVSAVCEAAGSAGLVEAMSARLAACDTPLGDLLAIHHPADGTRRRSDAP